MGERLTPIERLMMAMDDCARLRGEASWTNGYRTGKGESAESDLYAKEQRQWEACVVVDKRFRRLAQRLLREARNA